MFSCATEPGRVVTPKSVMTPNVSTTKEFTKLILLWILLRSVLSQSFAVAMPGSLTSKVASSKASVNRLEIVVL